MSSSADRGRFRIWPVRSPLSTIEREEAALQSLATALGEPVERAPSPALADAILICSGGVEQQCVSLVQGGAAPLVLGGPKSNAFAAGAEVAAWARLNGRFVALQPVAAHRGPELRAWLRAQRALRGLRDLRLGVVGRPAPWLVASSPSPADIVGRFGVHCAHVPWAEFGQRLRSDASLVRSAVGTPWSKLPRAAEVPGRAVQEASSLTAALHGLVRDRNLAALAFECFGGLERFQIPGCLALAELNEQGIPTACEADLCAALALLLARRLLGLTGWMANLAFSEGTTLWLSHCTCPPSLAETARLSTHFESRSGAAVAATLPLGERVTLVRLAGDLSCAQIALGRTREFEPLTDACRTQACVELDQPLPEVLGNHHVVIFGDHMLPLQAALRLAGLRVT